MNQYNNWPSTGLIRPTTLKDGGRYLLREQLWECRRSAYRPVKFVQYDPCPAYVVVEDQCGRKRRCLREDIWSLPALYCTLLDKPLNG
ncbi:MAG: hypothetical protein R3335_01265 [Anaerolineales bacterium]|nr:hypothetical protein [Anaerolineales bacterium]